VRSPAQSHLHPDVGFGGPMVHGPRGGPPGEASTAVRVRNMGQFVAALKALRECGHEACAITFGEALGRGSGGGGGEGERNDDGSGDSDGEEGQEMVVVDYWSKDGGGDGDGDGGGVVVEYVDEAISGVSPPSRRRGKGNGLPEACCAVS